MGKRGLRFHSNPLGESEPRDEAVSRVRTFRDFLKEGNFREKRMKIYGIKNETLGKFATELFWGQSNFGKNKSGKKELRERMKNEKKPSYVKAWKQKNR